MASNALNKIMAGLRRAVLLHDGTAQTDAKLLGSYVERRDETAFEALLLRHGPMVMGVCRRILRNAADAEDAFQATFLVLVRKANSVRPREQVGNWLYGVAHQTAVRTRVLCAKRGVRERQVAVMPETAMADPQSLWPERETWKQALDHELSHLPGKYRTAIVLCDLEGRTQQEAARQLGWPEGSVASRLSRGRILLVKRLAKHGLALSGEAFAVTLSTKTVSAQVPAALASTTLKAAIRMAAGQTAAGGAISVQVALITKGVLTSMLMTKLKTAAVAGIIVCVLGLGVGASFLAGQTPGEGAQEPVQRKGSQPTSSPRAETQRTTDEKTASQAGGKSEPKRESNHDADILQLKLHLDKQLQLIRDLDAEIKRMKLKSPDKPAPEPKKEISILTLRQLDAEELRETLNDVFNGSYLPGLQGPSKGSRIIRVRIALSHSTNTLILEGSAQDLQTAEAIAAKLEALPQRNRVVPTESKRASETKTESNRDALKK